MTRDLAYLLPLLLLACDAGPAPASDTDTDDEVGSSTSSQASTTSPDPTAQPGTTTGETTSGGTQPGTTDAEDTSGEATSGETTGDETTGDDNTTGGTTDDAMPSVCGDAEVGDGEFCDDGDNNGSYGSCADDCQGLGPHCGDGNTDAGFESCDDGDAINGNGCNVDCVVSGSTLWELTEASIGAVSEDVGVAIAARDDGTIRVGWRSRPTESVQQVFLSDYALDGSPIAQHNHNNAAPNSVFLNVQGVDASGGYLLSWVSTGFSSTPDDVIARSEDHQIDWSLEVLNASDVERRPGGGGVYLNRDNALDPTQWFVVDDNGAQTYFSQANPAIFDGGVVAAGDDSVAVIGAVDIGAGLEATMSRFTTGGTLEYRTFYELPPSGDLNRWVQSELAVNEADQLVAANTTDTGLDNQVLVASFNADGSLAWDTLYDHPGDDVVTVRATAIDADGNVFIVGTVRSGPLLNWDFDGLVVKYDASGNLLWAQTYAGDADQGSDSVEDVTVLEDDSIAITGARVGLSGTRDAWVARIAP